MTIYPAIDIKEGKCVRLVQGLAEQKTVYAEDPVEVARGFRDAGSVWVHVVDLDGAFAGEPKNMKIIEGIATLGLKVQLGGGLRNYDRIKAAFAAGVSRAVIGTRAVEDQDFVARSAQEFGARIAVGIDAKNGKVAVKGWVATADLSALDLAKRVKALGVKTVIHTDIGTDGMLTGPNLAAQEAMCRIGGLAVIASGGVGCLRDIESLLALSKQHPELSGVIVGKAIYEQKVTVPEMLRLVSL